VGTSKFPLLQILLYCTVSCYGTVLSCLLSPIFSVLTGTLNLCVMLHFLFSIFVSNHITAYLKFMQLKLIGQVTSMCS